VLPIAAHTEWSKKRGHSAFYRISRKLPKIGYHIYMIFAHINPSVCCMSVHSRFSNFISYSGAAIWRILTISVTAGLCCTLQIKMLNEYDLNEISSIVGS